MSTVHISANKGDFAETVLMPGDPHRSRFIAENWEKAFQLVQDAKDLQMQRSRKNIRIKL